MRKRAKMSKISILHYVRFVYRGLLFAFALTLYILNKVLFKFDFEYGVKFDTNIKIFDLDILDWLLRGTISPATISLAIFAFIYIIEITFRFIPHKWESMGCQKVFKYNYRPSQASLREKPKKMRGWRTFVVVAVWLSFNLILCLPYYFFDWYDTGILILISLLYGVCDMICILFYCPFQSLFMLNKCCNTCRIYNWDFAMMCTPLAFIIFPRTNIYASFFAYVSVIYSLILFLHWELTYRIHPERFVENTNDNLACGYCEEKLCQHKRQLRYFLRVGRKKVLGRHKDHEVRAELAHTKAMETMSDKEKATLLNTDTNKNKQ